MSSNERILEQSQAHSNSIKLYLNTHNNIEDWSVLYESNKKLPIKIYVKLSSYFYEDYGKIQNHIYGLGFSNIQVIELRKRY